MSPSNFKTSLLMFWNSTLFIVELQNIKKFGDLRYVPINKNINLIES